MQTTAINSLQNEVLAHKAGKRDRPARINREQIVACGLGKYLDDPRYVFLPLTRGQWTVVDSEDAAELAQHNWFARPGSHTWYASRFNGRHQVHLHRLVSDCPSGLEPDHRNHNGLDNTRGNLRISTHSQNVAASRKPVKGFRGVGFHPGAQKWQASIRVNNRLRHLGYFTTPQAAAQRYDEVALSVFGEYAHLNFPARKEAA
jgi:hypothetical protein